jgi:copper chaperone NosL
MKGIAIALVAALMFACSLDPEPLRYGKDVCHTCKMTLMDKRFGAELVTAKGKVYKFDDVNCMVNFINSGFLADQTLVHKLIVDYSQPEKLIPAEEAFYLKSDQIRTPMASQVAAFETEELMLKNKSGLDAIYLGWGELMTQFK